MPRRSTRIRDLQQRHSAGAEDGNGVNVETSSSNNERNVATNVYTNMDVEPVNNSPEHIIGGNTATTITNYHDRRRPASVLTPANTIRRSTRRRRFSNNNDNVITPANNDYTTPNSTIRSIRYGAQNASRSTGLRTGRRYNLDYFRQQRSDSETCDGSCTDKYGCVHCDKNRICVCLDTVIPMRCSDCLVEPCPKHLLIKCTNNLCAQQFHIDCVVALEGKTYDEWEQTDTDSFLCHRCKYCTVIQPNNTPWDALGGRSYKTKCQRLGLEYKNVNSQYSKQLLRNKVNNIQFNFNMLNDYGVYQKHLKLLNKTPVPFPTIVNMDNDMIDKHVLLGRRFESSMLMYNIRQCHCCGMVRPHHSDEEFPDDAIFKQKIFSKKMHETIHCTCTGFCKGSQFYSPQKPTQIAYYVEQHNGLYPWEVMPNLGGRNGRNSVICDDCYKEITNNNTKG